MLQPSSIMPFVCRGVQIFAGPPTWFHRCSLYFFLPREKMSCMTEYFLNDGSFRDWHAFVRPLSSPQRCLKRQHYMLCRKRMVSFPAMINLFRAYEHSPSSSSEAGQTNDLGTDIGAFEPTDHTTRSPVRERSSIHLHRQRKGISRFPSNSSRRLTRWAMCDTLVPHRRH